jgi:hypothetical protein
MWVEVPRARLTHPEANGHHGARLVNGQGCFLHGCVRVEPPLAGKAPIGWIAEGAAGAAGAGAPLPARSDMAGVDCVPMTHLDSQAASGPPDWRSTTSHFGGRPRRGLSAFQSVGPSRRTVRTVISSAAVLPPQTGQRRRQILAKGRAVGESAGWNRTGPVGGQRSVLAVPTGRPHGRQAISATISRWRRGAESGEDGMLTG